MSDELDQRSLTTGEVAGSGMFDELMRTVKSHVHAELKDGRINGEAYGQVYLGSMQSAMQTSMQYLLQYPITNKQLLLMDKQIEKAVKENELLDLQKEMLRVQIDTAQYNLDYMLPEQLEQLQKQNLQIVEQTKVVVAQEVQLQAQIKVTGKQEALLDEQIEAAKGQTVEMSTGLVGKQQAKAQAEIDILAQKELTEKAQTEGGYIGDGAGGTIGGLVGTEMHLKYIQKESFLRDAEQKAAKMYTDVFATLYATDPNDAYSQPENYGYDITTARNVMDVLLAGVNATRSAQDSGLKGDGVAVPEIKTEESGSYTSIVYPREIDSSDT